MKRKELKVYHKKKAGRQERFIESLSGIRPEKVLKGQPLQTISQWSVINQPLVTVRYC